ncbi:cytochrome P450 [Amylostereum chailletii]|nr:cytochrome P450 [Amylostereum chailletii]
MAVYEVVIATIFTGVALWLVHRRRIAPFRNIPGPPSASFATGNLMQMYGMFASDFRKELTSRYGRVVKLSGLLEEPILVVSDPKALSHMLVKDQDIFEESELIHEFSRLIFGPGLMASRSPEQHRKQRKLISPAFSTANMRQITPLIQSLMSQLQGILREQVADGPKEIDILDWMSRLALEAIAQGGMGHTFGALEGKNDEYGRAVKQTMSTFAKVQMAAVFLPFVTRYGSPSVLRWLAERAPSQALRDMVKISDTLDRKSREVLERKRALFAQGDDMAVNQIGGGKDLMSILLKANNAVNEEDRLPDDELVGQATTLLFAGTDTTSSLLARIIWMLAKHPGIQDKLREELREAEAGSGELNCDELFNLPYLEAVCKETLRLEPSGQVVQRVCRREYVLPLEFPVTGVDGSIIHELVVPKGVEFVVDILGVNRDPTIWGPDAAEWKPERWLSPSTEVKVQVPGVYANTLTFLGGGRSCIGMNFALLEIKVVMAQLISVFRFTPSDKEIAWQTGSVVSPMVKDSADDKTCLPVIMSLV